MNRYLSGASAVFAAPAGTGVFWAMTGSSTKVVRITKIVVEGMSLTAVGYLHIILKKNSTAPSGGTSTDLDKVPVDSAMPASTVGLLKSYTVAPTPGTPVGVCTSTRVLGQATTPAAAGIPQSDTILDYIQNPLVLRGTSEGVSLHFSGAPASAVTLSVSVQWEEE